MAQGRSARLACAAERTDGELCATAWNRRLFSDGGGGGGAGGGGGGTCHYVQTKSIIETCLCQ